MSHEGIKFERIPSGSVPLSKDPKVLVQSAVNEFPEDTMLYKGLSSNPELLEKISSVNGVSIDPEDMERRSNMYRKIHSTLHAKAGNAIETGSQLKKDEILKAEQFLNKEIEKLTLLRDALRA